MCPKYSSEFEQKVLAEAKRILLLSTNPSSQGNKFLYSWWSQLQEKIENNSTLFNSFEEAIHYAQQPSSGFDHRRPRNFVNKYGVTIQRIAFQRRRQLTETFPSLWNEVSELEESDFSEANSIIEIEGKRYSNIFLTHLYYYLSIIENLNISQGKRHRLKVVEIGGGYGSLARIFNIARPNTSYIIIDLPGSLCLAYIFLSANFPEAKIKVAVNTEKFDFNKYDFVLVPTSCYEIILGESIDVAINTGSFQEMTKESLDLWMELLQEKSDVSILYSFNYFLNDSFFHVGDSGDERMTYISPDLDPHWQLLKFSINPTIVTADAELRNWLELCVKRIPISSRQTPSDLITEAENASHLCSISQVGSNEYSKYAWLSILKHKRALYLDLMLRGVEAFKLGCGVVNHLYYNEKEALFGKANLNFATNDKGVFPIYGEELFYRKLYESLDS